MGDPYLLDRHREDLKRADDREAERQARTSAFNIGFKTLATTSTQ